MSDYSPPICCHNCGDPYPWAGRQARIYELQNRHDDQELDPADELVAREQLDALLDPDLDEEEQAKRWKRIATKAPGFLHKAGVERIVASPTISSLRRCAGLRATSHARGAPPPSPVRPCLPFPRVDRWHDYRPLAGWPRLGRSTISRETAKPDREPASRNSCRRSQSRCLAPLLFTTFQRLWAPPLFPENSTGELAPDALPPAARPLAKVSVGSAQLSRALVEQAEPAVGADAVLKIPWARLSEPYEVEM